MFINFIPIIVIPNILNEEALDPIIDEIIYDQELETS